MSRRGAQMPDGLARTLPLAPAMVLALLLALAMLFVPVAVPAAGASEKRPTVDEVSREVMCPTCSTTVDRSNSPVAIRIRAYIRDKVEAGWTKSEIIDGLVAEYGDDSIRARPASSGSGAVAWAVPIGFFLVACAGGVMAVVRWRRRGRA